MEEPEVRSGVEPSMVGSFSAGKVALFLHTPATGGTLVLGAHCCRLTPIQFALLELLLKQLREDESKHDSIKGFVSSSVLLGSLPWDAAHPDLTNLKQLVRRLRRRLEGHGVVLDSCCGLGYRLLLTAGAPPAL